MAQALPPTDPQTNQRAELSAIHRAVVILDARGAHDADLTIYTDSDYCINCLTRWLPNWKARNWKTASGSDVLHRDLIESTSALLAKFKSHRFVHVRAHTGGEDDLSKNNDVVDRMARGTIGDVPEAPAPPAATDVLFPGCPLQLLGPPVSQTQVTTWIREHLSELPAETVNKHLMKAFAELCKERDVTLTKQTIQKTPMLRAERTRLQISHVTVNKVE